MLKSTSGAWPLVLTLALVASMSATARAAQISLTPTPRAHTSTAVVSGCGVADSPAAIKRAGAVIAPTIAELQGLTGTSLIEIALGPTGSLNSAKVFASSGSRHLDNAALAAARGTIYAPGMRACTSVGGAYLLRVDLGN